MKSKQSVTAEQSKETPEIRTAEEYEQVKAEASRIKARLILFPQALKAVKDLIHLAEDEIAGGEYGLAAECLVCFTGELVIALGKLALNRAELFQPIGRRSIAWPVLLYAKKALNRTHEKVITVLQLGKDSFFSNRKWHPSAPSTRAAAALYTIGQSLERAGRLPPLGPRSKRQWFEESWKFLLSVSVKVGVKPEESELLAPLGKSKARKKPKYCKELHEKTRDSNVRAEIKARVWDAFDKLIVG